MLKVASKKAGFRDNIYWLTTWLEEVDGRRLWKVKQPGLWIEKWLVNGVMFFVHRHPPCGWEIFVPASGSIRASESIQMAEVFCGLRDKDQLPGLLAGVSGKATI